jgi:predicted ester cyclase
MTEKERDLGRRWFEEVWNKGRREAIAEMLLPDSVVHEGGIDTAGAEEFYPYFDRMRSAISDIHVTVEDTIVDGDKICVRWSFTGRHTGEGLGLAPTGVTIGITGITIMRVAGDKLIEGWQNWDMLGMMQQIQGGHPASIYIGAPSGISATGSAA